MTTFLPALIVAAILLLGLAFFVRRSRPVSTDRPEPGVSPTIHRVRANVRAILSKQHPTAVVSSYGATAADPRPFTITVSVATDAERDQIRHDPLLRQRFQQALIDADYPKAAAAKVAFDIESQQTIKRQLQGSKH